MGIEEAKKYAKRYHFGQVDKGGVDYFGGHIVTVATKVAKAGYSDEHIMVAYLHDVVEDTDATIEEIEEKFGVTIANAVKAISKEKEEAYVDYLEKVIKNKIAVVVKFYDMEHNSDISRLTEIRDKDLRRIEKYKKYLSLLEKHL